MKIIYESKNKYHILLSENQFKLLIGTLTTKEEPNYLMVINAGLEDDESQRSMVIETKINHQGEVLKVKNMPQQEKSHIIATKAINGEINIYDYSKIKGQKKKSLIKPDLRLKGHTDLGYAMDWNTIKEGFILSGAHDSLVNMIEFFIFRFVFGISNVFQIHLELFSHIKLIIIILKK